MMDPQSGFTSASVNSSANYTYVSAVSGNTLTFNGGAACRYW